MKTILTIILIASLVCLPADAKKKDPPLYDLTGTVVYSVFKSDYSVSVAANGETHSVGCNVYDTSASCSDTPGLIQIKFANGRTDARSDYAFDFDLNMYVVSPVPTVNKATFNYRLAHIKPRYKGIGTPGEGNFFCVPYGNYKGKAGEACYVYSGTMN